jgi:hypothetical protein
MESTQKELKVALSKYIWEASWEMFQRRYIQIIQKHRYWYTDLNQTIANHLSPGPFWCKGPFLSAFGEPESAANLKSPFLEMCVSVCVCVCV